MKFKFERLDAFIKVVYTTTLRKVCYVIVTEEARKIVSSGFSHSYSALLIFECT